MKKNIIILFFIFFTANIFAQVKLPAIFGDNMVLQQKSPIQIWGSASPGEEITVELNNNKVRCSASESGKWKLQLPSMNASGPFQLKISGKNEIVMNNVMIGEVWICSGQSNMEFPLKKCDRADEEISKSTNSSIRIFIVEHKVADTPQDDCRGKWLECSPQSIGNFSGVAYYFGKNLQKQANIPVGMIQSTWGGTPAEAWMQKEILQSDPDFSPILDRWNKQMEKYPEALEDYKRNGEKLVKEWIADSVESVSKGMAPPRKPGKPEGPGTRNQPSGLYNGMIYPLVPFSFRGVIWYQGESNAGRSYQYRKLFPALIKNWRDLWEVGDFPFYFVQLPNLYRQPEPSTSGWAELRESQLKTLSASKTGMAVTIDIGDATNLHPTKKEEVGYRLSLIALDNVYDRDELFFSGPIFKSYSVEGSKIRIKFSHTANGLVPKNNNSLKGFTISGDDKKFYPAVAAIDGTDILVWNENVSVPASVRYAWADNPECNLYNSDLLPASPFRTDDWPEVTFDKK